MVAVPFAAALFAAAALLFAAQPMAGKQLLPLVGGTPAVWAACLVFFQAVLLVGYLYADAVGRLPTGRQLAVHLTALGVGLLALAAGRLRPDPAHIPADASFPAPYVLLALAAAVGGPVLAVAATAPLVQGWFARTGHRRAADPYFLYAASNLGSLAGLVGYPFVVEPLFPIPDQAGGWAVGYAVTAGLVAGCGLIAVRRTGYKTASEAGPPEPPPSPARMLKWAALAALPASLLASVTTHLTTDVAPVPLLWVVPLGAYLATYVIAFAGWPPVARKVAGRVVPMLLVFLALALLTSATEPPALVAALHLLAFAGVGLLCHGELAADRPSAAHLTRFYLAASAGGVAGGAFNALVAPVAFADLGLAEYPLGIVLAALVRPPSPKTTPLTPSPLVGDPQGTGGGGGGAPANSDHLPGGRAPTPHPNPYPEGPPQGGRGPEGGTAGVRRDAVLIAAFAVAALSLALAVPRLIAVPDDADPGAVLVARVARAGLMYGVPAAVAFALVGRPGRFAAALGVLFLAGSLDPGVYGPTVDVRRNFFGTLRVTRSTDGRFVRLVHGTTLHGQQRADAVGMPDPLMYYHRKGPCGRAFRHLPAERKRRVGAVGLGVGAVAAYAEPGQSWAFFEIDPAVVGVARDAGQFTFLRECRADWRVVVGDARRRLAGEPDGAFDLLVLDAFSSDAVPVHLLTAEAFGLYARKLAPGGVVLAHLSNRYLDLPPLVARVAAAHDPPFAARWDNDLDPPTADGKFPSVWAVLSRHPADLGAVAKDKRWRPLDPPPGPVWRDDFANLLAAWKRAE